MFSALDVRVTLIEPRGSFLDFIDTATIQDFTHQIRENGVDLRLGVHLGRAHLTLRATEGYPGNNPGRALSEEEIRVSFDVNDRVNVFGQSLLLNQCKRSH